MPGDDWTFSIGCGQCGATAARISFDERRQFGLALAQQGFMGDVFAAELGKRKATRELFAELRDLARTDLKALRASDPDFFGFICRQCEIAYCRTCWTNVYPTFDDGFYDDTRGTCPHGHEQMLQD